MNAFNSVFKEDGEDYSSPGENETTTTTLAKKKIDRNMVTVSKRKLLKQAVRQKKALIKASVQPSLLPKPSLQTTPSSSNSKTYCIQRNPHLQNSPSVTPIQPNFTAPSPLTPTPVPDLTTAAPTVAGAGTPDKQNAATGIQSLAPAPHAVRDGQAGTDAPGPQDHPAGPAGGLAGTGRAHGDPAAGEVIGPGWAEGQGFAHQEPKLVPSMGVTATPNTAKKIFVSKDGKIIKPQVSNFGAVPPSKVQPGTQQKVQIVKNADGEIKVRGLLPGQQLVQMPDGKLQIFSSESSSPVKPVAGAKVLGKGPTSLPLSQQTGTPVKPSPQVSQQPSLLPKPSLHTTPAVPVVAGGAATPAKQNTVVGIQSLGTNTVTIKDGQLIVQGPDYAAATQIAKLLSSGTAKLANLNGKQVLLTTAPAKEQPAKEQPAEVETALTNTP